MRIYIDYENKSRANFSIYYYLHYIFKRVEFILFVIASIALIIFSKVNQDKPSSAISKFFVNISLPVVSAAAMPFNGAFDLLANTKDLLNARNENKALKEENEKLKSLYVTSLNINQENKELRELLKFVSVKSTTFTAARLIGRSNQIYSNNVFINAGEEQGIKNNNVVTGKSSLIGRVIDVDHNKSRVMLITDINSRTPVITSKSRVRAILAGNNSDVMEMLYLDKNHSIEEGDMVFTSGDGDSLPPGILVGIIKKSTPDYVSVVAAENINNIDIVTVLDY